MLEFSLQISKLLLPVGGLSHLSSSGWMKTKKCLVTFCTVLWKETKKMG